MIFSFIYIYRKSMDTKLNLSAKVNMIKEDPTVRDYRLTIEYPEAHLLNISNHFLPYFNYNYRPKSMIFTSEESKEQ